MSVVGSDYDELKQFNLTEIHDPTPKPDDKTSKDAVPGEASGEATDTIPTSRTNIVIDDSVI